MEKLSRAGIQISPLARDPKTFRDFDSFLKEALKTRNSFLIQCLQGIHASASYALYYLAVATPYSLKEIKEIFELSGRKKDFEGLKNSLAKAKIYLEKVVNRKMRRIQSIPKKAPKKKPKTKHRKVKPRKI